MTDTEWQKLQATFDTHRLLEAVDALDTLRGILSDDGHRPPEICDRLLRLHALAMAAINEGSRRRAGEFFDLAMELEGEAFEMLEAATQLHDTLSTLTELCPDELDDDERTKES